MTFDSRDSEIASEQKDVHEMTDRWVKPQLVLLIDEAVDGKTYQAAGETTYYLTGPS